MTTIDWVIVLVLNGGVIAAGVLMARGTKTSRDWFLGRRGLVWWGIALSMFATNLDNADLVSLGGTAYKEGVHILTVHSLGSVVGGILAAFFIVPTMYRAGLYTNAEYLEARFGPSVRILSAFIQIQYRTSMLGLMIWAVYLLMTGLLEMSSTAAWSLIVIMVVAAAVYTAWGGLRSVVMTDALQGAIMILGGVVIFSAVWNAVGGWSGAAEGLEAMGHGDTGTKADLLHIGKYRGDSELTSPWVVVVGWIIIGSSYWTVNHTQTMRLLGARTLWDMKMAALVGVLIGVPMMMGCILIGIFANTLYPDAAQPDQLYPLLANQYLTPGFKGLVVAGMFAAAISTFDSMGSSLSAVFTRDIYARFVVRDAPDEHYVQVGRLATVGILAIGFAYIPFVSSKDTMLKAFLTLIPVLVTPLFTVYLAGTLTACHRRGGLVGIVAGGIYGLVALYDREIADLTALPDWFTGRWEALLWSVLITGVGIGVTTLFLGTTDRRTASIPEPDGWLLRSREQIGKIREHPFREKIPVLLSPGWIAVVLLLLTSYLVFGVFW